jgi:hypothetical protein
VHNVHALARIAEKLGFEGPSIAALPGHTSPLAPRWAPNARSARPGAAVGGRGGANSAR